MGIEGVYDLLSWVVIIIALVMTVGVAWMWSLYFGPDNTPPRSQFLLVLCAKSTIIVVAAWPLAWLAFRRLQDAPSLGEVGGLILFFVILVLMIAPLITIGYLFLLRRVHGREEGKKRPPPFQRGD